MVTSVVYRIDKSKIWVEKKMKKNIETLLSYFIAFYGLTNVYCDITGHEKKTLTY